MMKEVRFRALIVELLRGAITPRFPVGVGWWGTWPQATRTKEMLK